MLSLFLVLFLPAQVPTWQNQVTANPRVSVDLRLQVLRKTRETKPLVSSKAVLLFEQPLSAEQVKYLIAAGVDFEQHQGQPLHIGPFYGATLTAQTLQLLLAYPHLKKVLPAVTTSVPPRRDNPYALAHQLSHNHRSWYLSDASKAKITGQGVVVCDMDTGIDLFHPLFFRADGGYFAWIDVDGNQSFDPAIDMVDLDSSGKRDRAHVLLQLGGAVVDKQGQVVEAAGDFVAGRHFLYADSNQNNSRDYGPEAGFFEHTPAYGEPLFVVDDVDGNGVLDSGEKLIRLSSSKIKAIVRTYSGITYQRGVDLIQAPVHEKVRHGTGVSSVILGGLLEHTMVQGVAPDAELIMLDHHASEADPDDPQMTEVAAIHRVRDLGAQVLVHEYGSNADFFCDGSDAREQLIDQLSDEGMVQAAATHNFAGAGGTAQLQIDASSTQTLQIDVYSDPSNYQVLALSLALRWLEGAAADLRVELEDPQGALLELAGTGQQGSYWVDTEADLSSRGTAIKIAAIYRWSGVYEPFPPGLWTLRIENTTDSIRQVRLHVSDQSGYADAASFTSHTTDVGSIAWPATADSAISTGALLSNLLYPGESQGDLAFYSGQGPRIDGVLSIDLVAPTDHYSAAPSHLHGDGHYITQGGTSGALPMVAGAIALLLQAEPEITPQQVKQRLQQSATQDQQTGAVPNNAWGHGKLDTYRLLTQSDLLENAWPTAAVSGPGKATVIDTITLDASASEDAEDDLSAMTFFWDFDYDGTWDKTVVGQGRVETSFTKPGTHTVKLRVEDSQGLYDQKLLTIAVAKAAKPKQQDCGCASSASAPFSWQLGLCGLLLLGLVYRRARISHSPNPFSHKRKSKIVR